MQNDVCELDMSACEVRGCAAPEWVRKGDTGVSFLGSVGSANDIYYKLYLVGRGGLNFV